jgi:hypothetical protein
MQEKNRTRKKTKEKQRKRGNLVKIIVSFLRKSGGNQ